MRPPLGFRGGRPEKSDHEDVRREVPDAGRSVGTGTNPAIPLRFIGYRTAGPKLIIAMEIRKTEVFANWFNSLRDRRAKARIQARIDRLELGHFGDVAPVGEGVSELRIFYGPGYRVYFVKRGSVVIILLSGGAKSTQNSDIVEAKEMAKQLET